MQVLIFFQFVLILLGVALAQIDELPPNLRKLSELITEKVKSLEPILADDIRLLNQTRSKALPVLQTSQDLWLNRPEISKFSDQVIKLYDKVQKHLLKDVTVEMEIAASDDMANLIMSSNHTLFPEETKISQPIVDRTIANLKHTRLRNYTTVGLQGNGDNAQNPGHIIIINGPFVENLGNGELAEAILAHEVGHGELAHGIRDDIGAAFNILHPELLDPTFTNIATAALSRNLEFEADRFAVEYLLKSKQDPRIMVRALKRVAELKSSSRNVTHIYDSHPVLRDRITAVEKIICRQPKLKYNNPSKSR
ncbi:uncharacterized protein VTP21DRAFT_7657 [Calcarisporiella thermophila]|uniref:uncharacterized protein n=1 Tax=Calcarisporiella thermophila TaxID=911321 RepID=UPI0037440ED5